MENNGAASSQQQESLQMTMSLDSSVRSCPLCFPLTSFNFHEPVPTCSSIPRSRAGQSEPTIRTAVEGYQKSKRRNTTTAK